MEGALLKRGARIENIQNRGIDLCGLLVNDVSWMVFIRLKAICKVKLIESTCIALERTAHLIKYISYIDYFCCYCHLNKSLESYHTFPPLCNSYIYLCT